jgi:Flp pilus assembly protein TadB
VGLSKENCLVNFLGSVLMFSKAKKKNMRSVSKTLNQKIKTKKKKYNKNKKNQRVLNRGKKKKKLTSGHMGNLFWFGRPCGHP